MFIGNLLEKPSRALQQALGDSLPQGNYQESYTILSFGCGAKPLEIKVLEQFRGRIPGMRYIGVDINEAAVQQCNKLPHSWCQFIQSNAVGLTPSAINLVENSVDLIILRHPEFGLVGMSSKEDIDVNSSVEELLKQFMGEDDNGRRLYPLNKKTVQKNVRSGRSLYANENCGDYINILEKTVPKFLKPSGKVFFSCLRNWELAECLYLAGAYLISGSEYTIDKSQVYIRSDLCSRNEPIFLDGFMACREANSLVLQKRHSALEQKTVQAVLVLSMLALLIATFYASLVQPERQQGFKYNA